VSASQIISAAAVGTVFGVLIVLIARRGILSMRYTFGWLFIACCIILGGLFGGILNHLASAIGVEPFVLVISLAAVGLLAITVQLSITVSGLTESVRTLAESVALLEEKGERSQRCQAERELEVPL
jgi:hypothetical protein